MQQRLLKPSISLVPEAFVVLEWVKTTTPRIPAPEGRTQRLGGGAWGVPPRGFESEVAGAAAMATPEERELQVTSGAGSGTCLTLPGP